jgi:hypothetical protein
MMKRLLLASTIVLPVLGLTVAASRGNAQILPPLASYTCNPESCFAIATGVGFFSSGMIIKGVWIVGDEQPKPYGTARAAITSMGCTLTVTIESLGYATSSPVLGDGVVADAVATQVGMQLLHGQQIRYLGYSTGFVEPSPEVPCI